MCVDEYMCMCMCIKINIHAKRERVYKFIKIELILAKRIISSIEQLWVVCVGMYGMSSKSNCLPMGWSKRLSDYGVKDSWHIFWPRYFLWGVYMCLLRRIFPFVWKKKTDNDICVNWVGAG